MMLRCKITSTENQNLFLKGPSEYGKMKYFFLYYRTVLIYYILTKSYLHTILRSDTPQFTEKLKFFFLSVRTNL
jgi:hypothetical protein